MKEKKLEILLVSFAAIVILAVVLVIVPLISSIENSATAIAAQKSQFTGFENRIANLEEFKEVKKTLAGDLLKFDNLFINGTVPVDFIEFLESLAKDYSVDVEITAGSLSKTKSDKWSAVIFNLASLGSFDNLAKFLDHLENSPYLISVQNLNMAKSDGGGVKANLSVKVFAK